MAKKAEIAAAKKRILAKGRAVKKPTPLAPAAPMARAARKR